MPIEHPEAERLGMILFGLPGAWPKDSKEAAEIKAQASALKAAERERVERKRLIEQVERLSYMLIRACRSENIVGPEKQMAAIRETIGKLNQTIERKEP